MFRELVDSGLPKAWSSFGKRFHSTSSGSAGCIDPRKVPKSEPDQESGPQTATTTTASTGFPNLVKSDAPATLPIETMKHMHFSLPSSTDADACTDRERYWSPYWTKFLARNHGWSQYAPAANSFAEDFVASPPSSSSSCSLPPKDPMGMAQSHSGQTSYNWSKSQDYASLADLDLSKQSSFCLPAITTDDSASSPSIKDENEATETTFATSPSASSHSFSAPPSTATHLSPWPASCGMDNESFLAVRSNTSSPSADSLDGSCFSLCPPASSHKTSVAPSDAATTMQGYEYDSQWDASLYANPSACSSSTTLSWPVSDSGHNQWDLQHHRDTTAGINPTTDANWVNVPCVSPTGWNDSNSSIDGPFIRPDHLVNDPVASSNITVPILLYPDQKHPQASSSLPLNALTHEVNIANQPQVPFTSPSPSCSFENQFHKPITLATQHQATDTTDKAASPKHKRTDTKNSFLIECKRRGLSYKEIKRLGNFKEAESTLRGRFRTLTKSKEHRVRKPQWQAKDVSCHVTRLRVPQMINTNMKLSDTPPLRSSPHEHDDGSSLSIFYVLRFFRLPNYYRLIAAQTSPLP